MPTQAKIADQVPPYYINAVVSDIGEGWPVMNYELQFFVGGDYIYVHTTKVEVKDGQAYVDGVAVNDVVDAFNIEVDQLNQMIVKHFVPGDFIERFERLLYNMVMELGPNGVPRVKRAVVQK